MYVERCSKIGKMLWKTITYSEQPPILASVTMCASYMFPYPTIRYHNGILITRPQRGKPMTIFQRIRFMAAWRKEKKTTNLGRYLFGTARLVKGQGDDLAGGPRLQQGVHGRLPNEMAGEEVDLPSNSGCLA